MGNSFLQKQMQAIYRKRLFRRPCQLSLAELKQPALVFAPHQDDEVLGCGGTILKKTQAGADVGIVFLTDGRSSHGAFMPQEELVVLRKEEAIAAAAQLGVPANRVEFLGFPDGNLAQHGATAVPHLTTLLQKHQPASVFVPYAKEPPPDHRATWAIVREALAEWQQPVVVYEYPVWYWHHWPWVALFQSNSYERRSVLRNTLSTLGGWRFPHHFQCAINVGDVLPQKKQALAQHKTQMSRQNGNPNWPILADVSRGRFLECLLQDYELFHRYDF